MTDYPVQERVRIDERTRLRYLQAMGIDVWYLKEDQSNFDSGLQEVLESASVISKEGSIDPPSITTQGFGAWLKIQSLKEFQLENGTVAFLGDSNAKLLVLSYDLNPSNGSEQQFSGKNGVLLRAMLRSVGLDFTSVMICNLEVNKSGELPLEKYITNKSTDAILFLINPELSGVHGFEEILASSPIRLDTDSIDVFVSYHPDFLLLNPNEKEQAWHNIKKIRTLGKT